jgi:D-alanyl-D-alanine carboxypeptidase
LVSSIRRDEKHIVAVVLGGTSNAARDARMRQLIEDHISQASTQGTVPIVEPSADRQWALYFAAQGLGDRIARLYGNPDWNKTKVNLVASEVDNFSGVIAPIDDVQSRSRI